MNFLNRYSAGFIQPALLCLLLLWSLFAQGADECSVLVFAYGLIILFALTFGAYLGKHTSLALSPLTLFMTLWLAWLFIPLWSGWVNSTALFGVFQCALWVFTYGIFLSSYSPKNLWRAVLICLFFMGLITALYALWQLFVKHDMPSGFFFSKNTNASFLMVVILLVLGEFFSQHSLLPPQKKSGLFGSRVLILTALYLMTLALLAALSRGVLISFALALSLLLFIIHKKTSRKGIYLVFLVILGAALTMYFGASGIIEHRLDQLTHEKSRFIIWEGAWHLWQNTSWYGLGAFNFRHYYPAFSLPGDGSSLEYAHNDFLQLLVETGIPGFLLLLLIIGSVVFSFVNYLKNNSNTLDEQIQTTSCFVAFCALAMHGLVDFNFYILLMNALLGCFLGNLHCSMRTTYSAPICIAQLKAIHRSGFQMILASGFILFSYYFFQLSLSGHHIDIAESEMKQGHWAKALAEEQLAERWFSYSNLNSRKADMYLSLAEEAPEQKNKARFYRHAELELKKSIERNPYHARSYFQLGLLNALFFNEPGRTEDYFAKALESNPHFCLARITYAHFLIESGLLIQAQQLLEQGLNYAIGFDCAENYLNLLAQLRMDNKQHILASKVVERLRHINRYENNYSDLI